MYPLDNTIPIADTARKVIYTAVAGAYDEIKQPLIVREDYDYICFVDECGCNEKCGVWQLRQIPFRHEDPTRRARFVKINPHIVLPEYDYSLWMDANVSIAEEFVYNRMDDLIDAGIGVACFSHWGRDCVYDEALECLVLGLDDSWKIIGNILRLLASRYPRHKGLIESNVMFRHHTSGQIVAVDTLWWKMLARFSKRDQLSLNYALWKNHVPYELIFNFNPSMNARNSSAFIYTGHKKVRSAPEGERKRSRLAHKIKKYLIDVFAP